MQVIDAFAKVSDHMIEGMMMHELHEKYRKKLHDVGKKLS